MNDLYLVVISYALIATIVFVMIDILLNGFVHTFLRVKMSRGKLLLVQIRGATRDYYKAGRVDEGMIVYKHSKDVTKRINYAAGALFRVLGVNCVQVEEETNSVVLLNFSAVKGFDAAKWDNLLKRALYRPSILDQKQKIELLLLGAILVAVIIVGVLVFKQGQKLDMLLTVSPSGVV